MAVTVGTKVRFTHPTSNGGTVRFTAKVVRLDGEYAWVEMPARVRSMPFPPLGGKRYGKYRTSQLVEAKVTLPKFVRAVDFVPGLMTSARRGQYRVAPTGEFRPPKAGEWYISGAIPEGYFTRNGLTQAHHIGRLTRVRVVTTEVEIEIA